MRTQVTEIAPDTYRISTFHHEYGLQFNQFLLIDEQPFLMHTGYRTMLDSTLDGIRQIIDPAKLHWIGFSHFEPDECGALNELLEIAPRAQGVASMVGSIVGLFDYAARPVRAMNDNEILPIGKHRLRFLATPHVPHAWDAGMFFDETEKTLFLSDLFTHGGNPAPLVESDIVGPATEMIQDMNQGPLAHVTPYSPLTEPTLNRLAALEPATLAVMHGSSYRGNCRQALSELNSVYRKHFGSA